MRDLVFFLQHSILKVTEDARSQSSKLLLCFACYVHYRRDILLRLWQERYQRPNMLKKSWRRRWRSKRFCKYGSFFTWKESRLMRSLAVISTLESSSPWPKKSALDIEAEPCNIPQVAFIIKKEWENVFFFQSCVGNVYLLKTTEE